MTAFIDLSGQTFGRLVVINRAPNLGPLTAWLCRCECGKETRVTGFRLRSGHTKSCGCFRREAPMSRGIDLTGRRFGRLVAMEHTYEPSCEGEIRRLWRCMCDCGAIVAVRSADLKRGNTKSCGCLAQESRTKHGGCSSAEYRIWSGMIQRCTNPNAPGYENYGGRGIKVCKRWIEFANFLADMGGKPSPQHSLDRKNNDGDYELNNCRWATRLEQARNKRAQKRNRFGIIGVHWFKRTDRWTAHIGVSGRTIHLGYFEKIEDAIEARSQAEKIYWGQRNA